MYFIVYTRLSCFQITNVWSYLGQCGNRLNSIIKCSIKFLWEQIDYGKISPFLWEQIDCGRLTSCKVMFKGLNITRFRYYI